MPVTSPTDSADHALHPAQAHVALCEAVLPIWGRHLATSRAQSEGAVSEMLKAFAEIGPHINMAERQSQQINDALAQPVDGVMGLANACAHLLAPVLADAVLAPAARTAIEQTLGLVRSSVSALEAIAKPFQHETQMVAAQVDRMYMGFQYQDRISQMLTLGGRCSATAAGDLQSQCRAARCVHLACAAGVPVRHGGTASQPPGR